MTTTSSPEAETLILLPGQLCDAALWQRIRPSLDEAAHGRVQVADMTAADTLPALADHVLALAPGRLALCGLSMGGYVAFELWRRAPERIARLAFLNTSPDPDPPVAADHRLGLGRHAQHGTFLGVTERTLPGIVHPSLADDPEIGPVVLAMARRVGAEAFQRQTRAIAARPDSRPLLPSITVPTLVVAGAGDRLTPPAKSEAIACGVPGAELLLLQPCGHLAPLERPQATLEALQRWLAR